MVPVDIVNLALSEIGQRVTISSFSDTSPAAQTARLNYTPRLQMLLRAANWDFARAQIALTVFKAALINGMASGNPPPQPWLFSYLRPSDCVRARFVMPTIPVAPGGAPLTTTPNTMACVPPALTSVPFVPATDINGTAPVPVILTNMPNAQLVYTRDLSQFPDEWDPSFLSVATAYLGVYFINALARNHAQLEDQIGMAKSLLDQARVVNGNEAINSIDHIPDWIRIRSAGGGWGLGYGAGYGIAGGYAGAGWDACSFPGGLSY